MNTTQFQAKLVAIAETGTRDKIVGAIMAGDDRTPLASSAWRSVVLPILQGDAASSKLSTVPAGKHQALLDAFAGWVKAVSKPGKGGAMSSDAAAISKANAAFSALDSAVGGAKAPARKKTSTRKTPAKPKPAAKKSAAKKPAAKKSAAKKPAAKKPAGSRKAAGSRKKTAASKPKPPARKPAARKAASSKPKAPARKPAARKTTSSRAPKGGYKVTLNLTFEEV